MSSIKIYPPNQLPSEGVTDVQFQIWKNELEVYLEIEAKFRKFLPGGKYDTWIPAEDNELRITEPKGTDTDEHLPEIRRELRQFITIVAKYIHLDYYNPVIRHSSSLKWIYAKIRQDYDIQQQGIHFLNLLDLKWDPTEQTTAIGFYNQYRSMIIGNLAKKDMKIDWKDETLKEDEKLTPSHEDLILLNVLHLLNPKLPMYIRENYADKIGQNKRLMDFKTEILTKAKQYIQEIETAQIASIQEQEPVNNYISTKQSNSNSYNKQTYTRPQQRRPYQQNQRKTIPQQRSANPPAANTSQPPPFCRVCQLSGLPRHIYTSHYLGQPNCPSLSAKDKQLLLSRITQQIGAINVDEDQAEDTLAQEYGYGVEVTDDQELDDQVKHFNHPNVNIAKDIQTNNDTFENKDINNGNFHSSACNYIQPIPAQTLTVRDENNKDVHLDLDSGATVSYVKLSAVLAHGFQIKPNSQLSNLADGKTKMAAIGEIDETFYRNSWQVKFHAIVTKDLHCNFVAGNNFIKANSVIQDFNSKTITVHKKYNVPETSKSLILPTQPNNLILQNNHLNVILPGQQVDVQVPHQDNTLIAVQPWHQNKVIDWPEPQICSVQNGKISILNNLQTPINNKNIKIQARTVSDQEIFQDKLCYKPSNQEISLPDNTNLIEINTSNIDQSIISDIKDIHSTYRDVFDENLQTGYNHRYGKHIAQLNWANDNRPQASKVVNINYDHDTKQLLQEVCDDLTDKGVLGIPQEHDVVIQLCSPSFLVRKQKAKNKAKQDLTKNDVRLVVNFAKINDHLKNLPTPITKPKDVFSQLGKWNYIISTDLHSGFFQNHMSPNAYQWLGISTPFGGMRFMKRSGQGLLGQSEELDELLSKVLGHEMKLGIVARIADDIYIGGDTQENTVKNYQQVLHKLQSANIKISASKTKVFLNSVDVLGWKWSQGGYLSPSPHRVNALRNTKYQDINTVKDMRSWLGLYKTLLPASPNLTIILNPFDHEVADKDSKEQIQWTRDLIHHFKIATEAIDNLQSLYLPHPDDQLLIEVDAAKTKPGIGHTLYAIKDGKKLPVAFHSVKLSENHAKWMACELEALAFATAVSAEYDTLKEAKKPVIISPDSKPVADAIKLIKKGNYSSSPRIQSFINNINRIPIVVQLASGKAKQNQSSDYQSRHPSQCTSEHCSICNFVNNSSHSVLLPTPQLNSVDATIPLNNRQAWNKIQDEQKACRETKSLLKSGKTPNKMSGKINSEIRRLCSVAQLEPDNLLVVKRQSNKFSTCQVSLTVIPQTHLPAVLWQIHNSLHHPTKSQLKSHFDKYYYSVGLTPALDKLYEECFFCSTQKNIPSTTPHQSLTNAEVPGTHFHADVIRRQSQYILTLRDHCSSFTAARIIRNETHNELRKALIDMIVPLKLSGPCEIKVDNARGFLPLIQNKDAELAKFEIVLIMTDVFNKNENAVIDKACYELEQELKRLEPDGRAISNITLQLAVDRLNKLLRRKGQISAFEMHYNRDMYTGQNLNLDYDKLRQDQIAYRTVHNERHNSKLKNNDSSPHSGDIVITKTANDKHRAKDVYLVTNTNEEKVSLQRVIHPHSQSAKLRSKIYVTDKSRVHVTKKAFKQMTSTQIETPEASSDWNPIRSQSQDSEDEDNVKIIHPPLQINNNIDTTDLTQDTVSTNTNENEPTNITSQDDTSIEHPEPHDYQQHIRIQHPSPCTSPVYKRLDRKLQNQRQKAKNQLERTNSEPVLSQRQEKLNAKRRIQSTFCKNIPQIDGQITDSSENSSPDQQKSKPRHSSTDNNLLDDTFTDHDSSIEWDYAEIQNLSTQDDMIFDDINLENSFMFPRLSLQPTSPTITQNRVYNLDNLLKSMSTPDLSRPLSTTKEGGR